ncbi:MAG TPA: cobalamin-independent methionine synthase II family protein [Dehalococcoidia bacterium]|nr:cobalamin-independent methionine synthase II family protein [Dehalococcoidia bacterium]
MKRSTDRILTSHAGNLPRPQDLWQMLVDRDAAKDVSQQELDDRVARAVGEVVRQQAAIGLDIINDGEQSKRSWQTYANTRLSGLQQRPGQGRVETVGSIVGRDMREFSEYFRGFGGGGGGAAVVASTLRAGATGGLSDPVYCVGPLEYIGQPQVEADIANLRTALKGVQVEEAVLTAIAPGTIEHWLHNEYYKTDEDFLFAIAEAMNAEYKAITDAGFLLQIDDPDLADAWQIHADMDVAAYRSFADLRVESINVALKGVPRESVRLHVCWGSIHGPHKHDIPLQEIADLILKVNAGVYSVEASNPRHEHEWRVWQDFPLPDGSALMPGVVGHASDFVEHPDLVAERLVRYASVVGRENVIAGTDCGLGGRVGHEKLVWAKFESLVEGARRASRELW